MCQTNKKFRKQNLKSFLNIPQNQELIFLQNQKKSDKSKNF